MRRPRELTAKQHKYMQARLRGETKEESKRQADYGRRVSTALIEKPGGVIWQAIRKALEANGMTDDWLAKKLKAGVKKSETAITKFHPQTGEIIKDPDLLAQDKFLTQIRKLKGYEREQPNAQVAIQINNQFPNIAGLAPGEAENLINALRAEIGARESADVLEAGVDHQDAAPCNEVGGTPGKVQEVPGN